MHEIHELYQFGVKIHKQRELKRLKQQLEDLTNEIYIRNGLYCKPGCSNLCCQKLITQPKNRILIVWKYNQGEQKQVLLQRGIFDYHPIANIRKIKYMRERLPFSSYVQGGNVHIMKVVVGDKQFFYGGFPSVIGEYFMKMILVNYRQTLMDIPKNMRFQGKVQGKLLKKSDVIGIWQTVQAEINVKQGLIYRKEQQQYRVEYIKEIWTWFAMHQRNYCIIKFKKSSTKRSLAIPLKQLSIWLPAFMMLLTKPQESK